MNLGAIVNPGDIGGLQTATSGSSETPSIFCPAAGAHASPITQGQADAKPRAGGGTSGSGSGPTSRIPTPKKQHPAAPQRRAHRRTNKQPQQNRGGAKAAMPNADPLTHSRNRAITISPRHTRHRQPPSPAGDRPHAPHANAAACLVAASGRSASLPCSSPAKDLLRRARATADVDTDWLGRRPTVMDVVLGNRPAVQEYSEDAVMEAIERSEAEAEAEADFALGPTAGRAYDLEEPGGRSLELYWEAQSARSRLAAGAGDCASQFHGRLVPGYQVSAERSTAAWAGDEEEADSPPSREGSFPSVGAPQHTNANVTATPTDH